MGPKLVWRPTEALVVLKALEALAKHLILLPGRPAAAVAEEEEEWPCWARESALLRQEAVAALLAAQAGRAPESGPRPHHSPRR